MRFIVLGGFLSVLLITGGALGILNINSILHALFGAAIVGVVATVIWIADGILRG